MKIAFITERNLQARCSVGCIRRDLILLDLLKDLAEVDVFFNDARSISKYAFLFSNRRRNGRLFDDLNEGRYDLTAISTYPLSPFLRGYCSLRDPKVFYLCDSAHHIALQVKGPKMRLLGHLLQRNEAAILRTSPCAFVGRDEVNSLPPALQPNAYIFPYYQETRPPSYNPDGHCLLVGNFSFAPNRKMLEEAERFASSFRREIWVCGPGIPKKKRSDRIVVKGYVDDLNAVYAGARALLYPLPYGTGIKNKVLEAFSFGIPVVGFKEAFTNLEVTPGHDCHVCTSMTDIISIANEANLDAMSANCHSLVEQTYSRAKVRETLRAQIAMILGR